MDPYHRFFILYNPLIDVKQKKKTINPMINTVFLVLSDLNAGAYMLMTIKEMAHRMFRNPMMNPSMTNCEPDWG
jgi:hypothetical protein